MMLLKTINPEEVNTNSIPGWKYRKAARAVVFDNNDNIDLLHVSSKNYYKLPGGGIGKGEDIKIALNRECEEELGIQVKIVKEIGSIIEYRAQFKLRQTSFCFLARTSSKKNIPDFTEEERLSGFEIIWTSPRKALRLLNLKQTSDYEGKFIEERDACFLNKALEKAKIARGT